MSNSYDACSKNAWDVVKGAVAAVVEQLEWWAKHEARPSSDDTDPDYWREEIRDLLDDRIHEAADSAIIYTSDQWDCARCLPCDESPADIGQDSGTIEELIEAQAFLSVRQCVSDSSDLEAAISVICDALAERAANMAREQGEGTP